MTRTLSAPVTVAFDYTRSTGPVIGRFLTGLRDGVVVGGRTATAGSRSRRLSTTRSPTRPSPSSSRWPPPARSPRGPGCREPVAGQPFDRPFAFALVTLDGADTPLLHAVDVASPADVATGMRVQARWAEERVGAITDIACFVPDGSVSPKVAPGIRRAAPDPETMVVTPVSLDYMYAASPEESAFYRGLAEGRIVGQRCPTCHKVYVPPRSACPTDGTPTTDEVELSHTGTVTTFCVVNVPFLGQRITPPYVSAYVLLDGADIAFLHLILDIPADEVRMGMRVTAVWKPREEWGTTIENISHFTPADEPDADYDTYRQHL